METHSKKRRIERAGFPNLEIRDLSNGVRCYIFNNELPPGTRSISLIVKAGMLCEEENETGTAHLLEHMLVKAAADSIDSEFLGHICSHTGHETTQTHTRFNFVIKKDDELLAALKMFRLIVNQELAITEAHLEGEREVVHMEYIADIESLANITHFISIVEGHASLKMCFDNLDKIDLAMVNSFYKKWYIPSRMALLAIGKFDIEELQEYCGVKNPGMTSPLMDRSNNWTPGLIIRNADSNCLVIRCQRESDPLKALGRQLLVMAIYERLQSAIKTHSTLAYRQHLRSDTFIVLSSDGSLKKLVCEFLRLQKFGLTSSEKERQFSEIKEDMTRSLFLCDQDENYRTNELQKYFLDHFLYDDEITAPVSVAKLIEDKSSVLGYASDCLKFFDIYQSKIYDEGESFTSLEELIEECEKELKPWIDTDTGMVLDEIPEDVAVLSVNHMNDLGMHEFVLDNGMRVLLGSSSLPHAGSVCGFAHGGLLQLDEAEYVSSWFALELVNNLPSFPLEPYLKEFKMKLEVEDYMRSFHAFFNSSALASVLKLVKGLFCNKPDPDTEELYAATKSVQRQRLKSDVAFEYASGRPSWQRIPKRDFVLVGQKALKFYSECFLDPSQFTLVICGDFSIEEATRLSQFYLESIPRQHSEIFPSDGKKLNTFLIKAPQQVLRRHVNVPNHPKTEVYVCLPLKMSKENQDEDEMALQYLPDIVARRLSQCFRMDMKCIKLAKVYSVKANVYFDCKSYASPGCEDAILMVQFLYKTCPQMDWSLTIEAQKAIAELQLNLAESDLAGLPPYTSDQKKIWSSEIVEEVVKAYQSKTYTGDLRNTILERRKMLQQLLSRNISYWRKLITRLMPYLCTSRSLCIAFRDGGEEAYESEEEPSSESEEPSSESEEDSSESEEDSSASEEDSSESEEDSSESEEES